MNVLLIDDEPAAITALRSLLTENFPTVEILGTAANVCEGLQQIDRLRPKLIFLDVEMPGGSGFDLLRRLPTTDRPEVIFVTSKEEYALRAIQA
ncbi:MAG: response regulator, partial [Bacteroidota bacterium]